MNYRALCFVNMPFGKKPDLKSGVVVDFDQIYNQAIKPAIEECGLEALRGDEERTGGIIHRAMFARLLLAEFVVADLTLANANVFYEFGIRHAAKPFTTVPILANVSALPFDVALVRAVGYQLENGKLTQTSAQQLQTELAKRLRAAIDGVATNDSPLFQLIPKFPGIDLPGDVKVVPRSVLIELMSSLRDAEAFEDLIALYNAFPDSLKDYVVTKQQFALALNRRSQPGDREKALKILDELLKNRGADSETLGIKGRIHKDIYQEAAQAKKIIAGAALELACISEDWTTANRVLPKAILAATASFETATTLGNLRLLKQARERAGRAVTELDGIINELLARDRELRGEEETQPDMKKS